MRPAASNCLQLSGWTTRPPTHSFQPLRPPACLPAHLQQLVAPVADLLAEVVYVYVKVSFQHLHGQGWQGGGSQQASMGGGREDA